MDKTKFEQIKKEAVSKVEDSIVKAKIFIEKHPVACAIGGTAIGAVIAGAIGKKIGYDNGTNETANDYNTWLEGTNNPDKIYLIADENVKSTKDLFNRALYGGSVMNLDNNEYCIVAKDDRGTLVVDKILNGDIIARINKRLYEEMPNADSYSLKK